MCKTKTVIMYSSLHIHKYDFNETNVLTGLPGYQSLLKQVPAGVGLNSWHPDGLIWKQW